MKPQLAKNLTGTLAPTGRGARWWPIVKSDDWCGEFAFKHRT